MALDLRIAGPSFELTRRLQPGAPALVLGRDTDCSICLPDPERNVSRRHLSVWNEGDQLHFHVLSIVNGVETPMGELPPGARGVLAPGHTMALSAYRIVVLPVADAAAAGAGADPWAEFERQAAELAAASGPETVPVSSDDDDPFSGDWGLFHSTFGPGAPGGPLRADALAAATDLQPFLAGLGADATAPAAFTRGELEALGRVTRIALQGLLQAGQAAAAARTAVLGDAGPGDLPDANPLRTDAPLQAKLDFLLTGRAAPGTMAPDRALAQFASELAAHEEAMGTAVRELVAGVLQEFDPEALKDRLLGSGGRLFESARAWDAFVRDYAQRRGRSEEWMRRLMDRHFLRAYAQALVRAKRNTMGRSPG
jgi:predicted component of type VI protein secretion system